MLLHWLYNRAFFSVITINMLGFMTYKLWLVFILCLWQWLTRIEENLEQSPLITISLRAIAILTKFRISYIFSPCNDIADIAQCWKVRLQVITVINVLSIYLIQQAMCLEICVTVVIINYSEQCKCAFTMDPNQIYFVTFTLGEGDVCWSTSP